MILLYMIEQITNNYSEGHWRSFELLLKESKKNRRKAILRKSESFMKSKITLFEIRSQVRLSVYNHWEEGSILK